MTRALTPFTIHKSLILLAGPVESSLGRSIWVGDVSVGNLNACVSKLVEGHAVLVERELDMAVVKQSIDARIFSRFKLVIA